MQIVSKKYCSGIAYGKSTPSDRFDVRLEIAREVSRNVAMLNSELCDDLLKQTIGSVCVSDKKVMSEEAWIKKERRLRLQRFDK